MSRNNNATYHVNVLKFATITCTFNITRMPTLIKTNCQNQEISVSIANVLFDFQSALICNRINHRLHKEQPVQFNKHSGQKFIEQGKQPRLKKQPIDTERNRQQECKHGEGASLSLGSNQCSMNASMYGMVFPFWVLPSYHFLWPVSIQAG